MIVKKWFKKYLKSSIKNRDDIQKNKIELGNKNLKLDQENFFKMTNSEYQLINCENFLKMELIKIDDYFYSEINQYYSSFNKPPAKKGDSDIIFSEILKCTNQSNFKLDDFEKFDLLGHGFYGKVFLVKHIKLQKLFALKCLKKSKLIADKDLEHLGYEQRILSVVDHPFIVKLIALFQDDKKIYILTDYYSGGELFHLLRRHRTFHSELAKFYFAQILLSIEFLHNKKIIYRDLKPENILLDSEGYVKLADFGLAKNNFEEGTYTSTFCGTNEYLAPEIILGEAYSRPVDIWCLGILLYEMLYGIPPFYDTNKDRLFKKILFSEPDFSFEKICISENCKNLISFLLDKNPKTRIHINKIRTHPYFENFDFQSILNKTIKPPLIEENKPIERIGSYSSTNCSDQNHSKDEYYILHHQY
jgi:serine/threonine protein kinase